MTDESLFESAWLKWGQAIVHTQTFERDVGLWTEDNPDPVRASRAEYQAKRHGFALIIEDLEPIPVRWRLMLGDIASNYRAALDHLAWALASRGKTPPGTGALSESQESGVYFPICQERHDFNCEIRTPTNRKSRFKLPGIRLADSAIVRRVQPYHHGPRKRKRHALTLLADINTGDKHRTIQPIWAHPYRVNIEVVHERNCVGRRGQLWKRRAQPLDIEAEIGFIPARRLGPNPELEVNLDIAATPSIVERISVREWHAQTGILIFKLLREFSPQPESIHELHAALVPAPAGI
jgi:hypothetical protein